MRCGRHPFIDHGFSVRYLGTKVSGSGQPVLGHFCAPGRNGIGGHDNPHAGRAKVSNGLGNTDMRLHTNDHNRRREVTFAERLHGRKGHLRTHVLTELSNLRVELSESIWVLFGCYNRHAKLRGALRQESRALNHLLGTVDDLQKFGLDIYNQ